MNEIEILVIVIASLASGLVATGVTLYWQEKNEIRRRKFDLLVDLQSHPIDDERFTYALNRMAILFADDDNVVKNLRVVIDSDVLPGKHLEDLIAAAWESVGLKIPDRRVFGHRYGKTHKGGKK